MSFRTISALILLSVLPSMTLAQKLPEKLTASELQARGAQRFEEGLPADLAIVEGPRGPVHTTKWLDGAEFRHSVGAYVSDQAAYHLRFIVHFQSPEHRPFAERAGRFLGVLWGLANRRFAGAVSRLREAPISVWMTREGAPGAEQHAANLFIYNVLSSRSGIEWARELAHEYGHYVLPGATGYTHPESWSNGLLGERLFIHWLLQELTIGRIKQDALPFVTTKEAQDYCDRQVFPLIDPVRTRGPQPALISGSDEKALDALTGLMVYIDATYGSPALLQLNEYLPAGRMQTPQGIDFLVAFITWTREEPVQTINLPSSGATMVYLSRGEFALRQESGRPGKLSLNGGAIQGSDGEWSIRVPVAGWRTLSLADAGKSATIRLQRRGAG